ncbi:MAG: aminoacyl-histidine dipeptidase [Desulfobacterales bacterium]|nr:aminoacyl-histidine dipeptidase [Desulfobacterales bacterium]
MTPTTDTVIDLFTQINAIPRCSKNETAIGRWLEQWAQDRSLETARDAVGNLVIRMPASPGFEQAPVIVLQGHMDMVCEKTPDSDHDFEKDPISVIRDGDWLHADGTTLGADNGIALALALVAGESLPHPPLELLFTVDEESGLIGANHLDASLVRGKVLINIDSEDDNVFTIGCAGGEETRIRLALAFESPGAAQAYFELTVGGLRGGHSGIDIHKPRANANRILGRLLVTIAKHEGFRLASLAGGSAHNAIPRDARAVVGVAPGEAKALQSAVQTLQAVLAEENGASEPQLALGCVPLSADQETPSRVISPDAAARAIALLNALPHGVQSMSATVEGLVETSCNLAILKIEDDQFDIVSSQRSLSMTRLEELTGRVRAVAALAGAGDARMNHHPSWPPDPDSALLERCREVYTRVFEEAPVVEVIHAGLECGLIGAKVPGMEMISVGPTLRNPHSPDEKLFIPSIDKMLQFLAALLESYRE